MVHPDSRSEFHNEAEPECKKCDDSLWILVALDNGEQPKVVAPCDCRGDTYDERNRLRMYAQLGSLDRFKFGTLRRNFRGVEDVGLFQKAKAVARRFADDPQGWLVLEGSSGSGKTHFAAAIVNALVTRGFPAKYISALDIPDLIRRGWSRGLEDFELDGFEPLLEAPVLAIDDFGVQPAAEWVDTKIEQLLTYRFNSRVPTVVALAKPLTDFPERFSTKFTDPNMTRVIELTRVYSIPTGVPSTMLEGMTFQSFNPNGAPSATDDQKQMLKLAVNLAKDFVEKPEQSNPWIYLQGKTGVGKTHLSVAIAGSSNLIGVDVHYWSLPELLDRLRQTYSDRSESQVFRVV